MNRLCRFSWCSLLLVLLAGMPALAQDSPSEEEEDAPLLRGSNRALSFSFDALSLRGLDGGVGGKLWIGPGTALRLSFDFLIESDEDVAVDAVDDGLSAVRGGLGFMVEWHSAHLGRVSPYLGTGFSVGAGASSRTTRFSAPSDRVQTRFKTTALDFSILAALGVEWQITRRVSLSGEHQIGANVLLGTTERIESFTNAPEVVNDGDTRQFSFGTGTSSIIVSIYF